MSESKFTPGPWSVPHFATAKDRTDCKCDYVLCEHYMGSICSVSFYDPQCGKPNESDHPPLDEAKANARLIAAAPELLAGLKDLFAMMDEGVLVRETANDADAGWAIKQLKFVSRLQKAQAAISKAEGTV